MRHGNPTDYAAPFLDVCIETPEETADRIAGIGRDRLLAWWERTKRDTHPGSYGQTDHDRASWIAATLAYGYDLPNYPNPVAGEGRRAAAMNDCLRRLRA